jgi:hypothetical protein
VKSAGDLVDADLAGARNAVGNTVDYARATMGEQAFREAMTPELPEHDRIRNPYTYTTFEGSDDRHTVQADDAATG